MTTVIVTHILHQTVRFRSIPEADEILKILPAETDDKGQRQEDSAHDRKVFHDFIGALRDEGAELTVVC